MRLLKVIKREVAAAKEYLQVNIGIGHFFITVIIQEVLLYNHTIVSVYKPYAGSAGKALGHFNVEIAEVCPVVYYMGAQVFQNLQCDWNSIRIHKIPLL
jgi:hypothetical protein